MINYGYLSAETLFQSNMKKSYRDLCRKKWFPTFVLLKTRHQKVCFPTAYPDNKRKKRKSNKRKKVAQESYFLSLQYCNSKSGFLKE